MSLSGHWLHHGFSKCEATLDQLSQHRHTFTNGRNKNRAPFYNFQRDLPQNVKSTRQLLKSMSIIMPKMVQIKRAPGARARQIKTAPVKSEALPVGALLIRTAPARLIWERLCVLSAKLLS